MGPGEREFENLEDSDTFGGIRRKTGDSGGTLGDRFLFLLKSSACMQYRLVDIYV